MSRLASKFIFNLVLYAAIILAASPAKAEIYQFTQSGYSGGGLITGTFTGVDGDSDGQIVSYEGEVSGFTLSFTGDKLVPNFTHSFQDLTALVYNIGTGQIGGNQPATGMYEQGIGSNWQGTTGFDYATGYGPLQLTGGRVIDIATGYSSSTLEPVYVSSVPEPSTYTLIAIGLLFAGFRLKKSAVNLCSLNNHIT